MHVLKVALDFWDTCFFQGLLFYVFLQKYEQRVGYAGDGSPSGYTESLPGIPAGVLGQHDELRPKSPPHRSKPSPNHSLQTLLM